MYYYTILFILSFYNFFYIFGQNLNDPDYYPPQIDPNTDPLRRYLRLWSGILRNVAGDTEPNNYYQQNNNIRDYQQNGYQTTSYNEYNQKPFENLIKLWKNRIEEINLAPKNYNDGIPINQLKYNGNQENNDQQPSVPVFSNIKNNNDKEIINEMLLHKLLPRNKGDMYAFTSTTLKPSSSTTITKLPNKLKNKNRKKLSKKDSTKISYNPSTLSPADSNIGKNYKAKVRIGPSKEIEETTTILSTDTTITSDIEGSGEEIITTEKENITNATIDSEEEDSFEVEEVIGNENDVNKQNVTNSDNTNDVQKTSNKVLKNNIISNNNNSTKIDKKKLKIKDKEYEESDNSEYVEYSEEQNTTNKKILENNKNLTNNTIRDGNEEEYKDDEYFSEEEGEEEVSTITEPTTTTILSTSTTTTQKIKTTTSIKNNKQTKKEKFSVPVKMNKKNNNNKKKIKVANDEINTIPEAEEEEDFLLPKHIYASQIDSLPETETISTTKAPYSQPQSVYNFYTNANANSTPNNSNTVVPVNTMVDGILPLLIPLLASRTPYIQNMFDNLAYGVKTNNDYLPIKNESLIMMSKDNNDYNDKEKHLLTPIDKKLSNAIDNLKSINKKISLDYLTSVIPKQISNTDDKKNIQYYKTKIPENISNRNNIPLRPIKILK